MTATMLFVFAVLTLAGYVCRLDPLQFRLHRLGIIILHWAGGGSAAWAMTQAALVVSGKSDYPLLGCWMAVTLAASWLWVSYSSWRDGVPAHYLRRSVARSRSAWQAD